MMGSVRIGGEGCTIVRDLLHRDDSSILTFQLKVLIGLESFISVEMLLKHIFHSLELMSMKSAPPAYMSVSLVMPLEVKSLPLVEQM